MSEPLSLELPGPLAIPPAASPAPPGAGSAMRTAPPALRGTCGLLLLVVMVFLGFIGYRKIAQGQPDFEYFYKAGRWLLDHGGPDRGYERSADGQLEQRGTIEWYLPFTARLFTLLAWLPQPTAGLIWLGLNLALWVTLLRSLGRGVSGLPPDDWPVTMLTPTLLLGAYWYWEFTLNQIDVLMLALVVGGFVQWRKGRPLLAGFLTGLAVLLKLTPALVVLWFGLKRQGRAVAAALATILLLGPLADAVIFGGDAPDVYRGWYRAAVERGSHAGLIRAGREMDWRNQGLGATLARWLSETSYALRFDNDPRLTQADPPVYMNIANLSRDTVATLTSAAVAALLLGMCWRLRRPAAQLSAGALRVEWALVLLLMLALMPVLRRYHFIGLLPPLAVLAGAIHHAGPRRAWTWLAAASVLLVGAAQLTLLVPRWEATGAVWCSIIILAAPLLWLHSRVMVRSDDVNPASP